MLSKDIVNMIYRLIHNDYIKALNNQYHNKFYVHEINGQFVVLRMRGSLPAPFNYRDMDTHHNTYYKAIYRLTDKLPLWEPVAKLPKHYFTYSFLCI